MNLDHYLPEERAVIEKVLDKFPKQEFSSLYLNFKGCGKVEIDGELTVIQLEIASKIAQELEKLDCWMDKPEKELDPNSPLYNEYMKLKEIRYQQREALHYCVGDRFTKEDLDFLANENRPCLLGI